jgi:chromatin assembly factor 1 subunit A
MNGLTGGTQPLKAARMVPPEDLEAFKTAIEGQDLTKIAMIEHLKKMYGYSFLFCMKFINIFSRFPKLHKDAIANTLSAVAEREGKKASAKWQLKSA